MRATSTFSFEVGISTRAWRALAPLRIRVSKSEIGSVCIFFFTLSVEPAARGGRHAYLPAGLHDSGNLPFQGVPPETDAAHLKLAQIAARAAAQSAAVAHANLELRFPAHLGKL